MNYDTFDFYGWGSVWAICANSYPTMEKMLESIKRMSKKIDGDLMICTDNLPKIVRNPNYEIRYRRMIIPKTEIDKI